MVLHELRYAGQLIGTGVLSQTLAQATSVLSFCSIIGQDFKCEINILLIQRILPYRDELIGL